MWIWPFSNFESYCLIDNYNVWLAATYEAENPSVVCLQLMFSCSQSTYIIDEKKLVKTIYSCMVVTAQWVFLEDREKVTERVDHESAGSLNGYKEERKRHGLVWSLLDHSLLQITPMLMSAFYKADTNPEINLFKNRDFKDMLMRSSLSLLAAPFCCCINSLKLNSNLWQEIGHAWCWQTKTWVTDYWN